MNPADREVRVERREAENIIYESKKICDQINSVICFMHDHFLFKRVSAGFLCIPGLG